MRIFKNKSIFYSDEKQSLFKVKTAYFYRSRKATNQISARIHRRIGKLSDTYRSHFTVKQGPEAFRCIYEYEHRTPVWSNCRVVQGGRAHEQLDGVVHEQRRRQELKLKLMRL